MSRNVPGWARAQHRPESKGRGHDFGARSLGVNGSLRVRINYDPLFCFPVQFQPALPAWNVTAIRKTTPIPADTGTMWATCSLPQSSQQKVRQTIEVGHMTIKKKARAVPMGASIPLLLLSSALMTGLRS